jgi:hypothetical protein
LHGVRLELGEVEHCLIGANVRRAVVCARRSDSKLIAFVEPRELDLRAERRRLSALLPRAAVPHHIEPCDELPRNTAGKLDRAALQRRADTMLVNRVATSAAVVAANASLLADGLCTALYTTRLPQIHCAPLLTVQCSSLPATAAACAQLVVDCDRQRLAIVGTPRSRLLSAASIDASSM